MKPNKPYLLEKFDLKHPKGIATFMGAPLLNTVENPEIGIVGIPFDGAMAGIPGTRLAPREIRNRSMPAWVWQR